MTGLLVQPIIGYRSDRTRGRLGRRRPYFLAGAILCAVALAAMPHAHALWMAALLLWLLDVSINVSMEPFRAFVGDMLDERQRPRGYAFQTVFIGTGAVAAACAPAFLTNVVGLPNTASPGSIPVAVRIAFYGGAAVLLATVLWTVVTTREYSPAELRAFDDTAAISALSPLDAPGLRQGAAWLATGIAILALVAVLRLDKPLYVLGGALAGFGAAQLINRWRMRVEQDRLLNHLLSDLNAMPGTIRRLALVQFLSWFGLFILWIYATPIVTRYQFGATDVASRAYNDGADWVGVLFGAFNAVAALYAFAIPTIGARIGAARLHAINLAAGGVALASFAVIRDPDWLLVSMIGVGMAWASILTIPYALLCAALPANKIGTYLGLFNIFIVLPQLAVSTVMGTLGSHLYPGAPVLAFVFGGMVMTAAGGVAFSLAPRLTPPLGTGP